MDCINFVFPILKKSLNIPPPLYNTVVLPVDVDGSGCGMEFIRPDDFAVSEGTGNIVNDNTIIIGVWIPITTKITIIVVMNNMVRTLLLL
jgi:hypothetical protein